MGCSHPYDWSVQSPSHTQYFRSNYPTMEMVAAEAEANPGDPGLNFDKIVASLDEGYRADYLAEYNLWWDQYGRAWDELGCPRETFVGEHTAGYKWEGKDTTGGSSEVSDIQRKLMQAGFNPGPIDGVWGKKTCAACYAFNKQVRKSYEPNLSKDFFYKLGFFNTTSEQFAARYGEKCRPYYAQYGTTLQAGDIQAVQAALKAHQYAQLVDGILGAETARNLYAAQSKIGITDCALHKETFFSLDFDDLTSGMYAGLFTGPCKQWCPSAPAPSTPKPKEEVTTLTPPIAPVTEKKPFPWWMLLGIIGVGGVLALVAAGGDDKKKGKK